MDILTYLQQIRQDVLWVIGPDDSNNYSWDNTLPNQQEIEDSVNQYKNNPPIEIPEKVTPRQMRTALVMSGITLASIDAVLDSLPEPDKSVAKISWEFSNEVQRQNPLIDAMAPALGLTPQQIDDLFVLAETL